MKEEITPTRPANLAKATEDVTPEPMILDPTILTPLVKDKCCLAPTEIHFQDTTLESQDRRIFEDMDVGEINQKEVIGNLTEMVNIGTRGQETMESDHNSPMAASTLPPIPLLCAENKDSRVRKENLTYTIFDKDLSLRRELPDRPRPLGAEPLSERPHCTLCAVPDRALLLFKLFELLLGGDGAEAGCAVHGSPPDCLGER